MEQTFSEVWLYVLAVSVGFESPLSARLFKSGEINKASNKYALFVLAFTVLTGLVTFSALFYFSWAFLSWAHYGAALVAYVIGDRVAVISNSKISIWILSVIFLIAGGASELIILGFI